MILVARQYKQMRRKESERDRDDEDYVRHCAMNLHIFRHFSPKLGDGVEAHGMVVCSHRPSGVLQQSRVGHFASHFYLSLPNCSSAVVSFRSMPGLGEILQVETTGSSIWRQETCEELAYLPQTSVS